MRRMLAAGVAGLTVLVTPACSEKDPPTYDLRQRTVRDLETPLPYRETKLGELTYTVLAIRTGIGDVVGSHGSLLPKGQYVRVRLQIENLGRDRHEFVPSRQLLVATDGRTYRTSPDAMNVSRAVSGTQTLARQELRELDLWYDIPKNATVRSLRIAGDISSSHLGDQVTGAQAANARTVDIPLKP